MSELDETLVRWRRETEQVQPSAALLVKLSALAVAQSSAPPAAGAKAAGAGAVAMKAAVVMIAVAVLGVLGAVLVLPRAAAPVKDAPPPAPAELARPAPPPALSDPAPIAVSVPAKADQLAMVENVPAPRPAPTSPRPPRLARAIERLPLTCTGQRNVLVELVRDHGHEDPDAAAAALARWTLLCRTVTGPAIDDYRWFWPWGLAPSNSGSSCKTVMSDPSCAEGQNITESIGRASECVRATTPGSCARRAARLQKVFASCEALLHERRGARSALDAAVTELTGEFGARLSAAAWCLTPAAQAEAVRLRDGR